MAKVRPSVQKRARESKKMERKRAKASKKGERRDDDDTEAPVYADGVDPDLAGIVAGPQPHPFLDDDGEEEAAAEG